MDTIITKISDSFSKFKEVVATQLTCSGCKIDLKLTDSYCITLDQNKEMIKIENLLEIKTEQQRKKHYCTSETSRIEVGCELKCNASSKICIFNSEFGMEVDLLKLIEFAGIFWKCTSTVSSTRYLMNGIVVRTKW